MSKKVSKKKVRKLVKHLRDQQHSTERSFRLARDNAGNLQHLWSTAKAIEHAANTVERELLGEQPNEIGSMCQ